jgi:hypothetical protein
MKPFFKITAILFLSQSLFSQTLPEGDNGFYIYLHGKKQYVLVEGKGEPTVVFVTGKGRPQTDFKKVYTKLKKTNQIFSYDRAGLGKSELIRNERRVDTMAYELHELLIKAKIKPPYVLVGHSLGGSIMRCFASMYPTTVVGLVFVEPLHEEEFKYGLEIRSDSDKVVFRNEFKSYLKTKNKAKGQKEESKESFDFDTLGFSTNQKIVKDLKLPTTIPMTLLISMSPDVENNYIEKELKYKLDFFENWKKINPNAKIISTYKSGYFIQKDEPSLVVDEINEMIGKIKAK